MTRWDAKDIPSLEGKTAVVTGSNAGLGLEAAILLGRAGARVIMACRNQAKAETAAARVDNAEIVVLDLASLKSVSEAADDIKGMTSRLDIIVNNAGLMAVDQSVTADGFETQFGVNHLGHFAFTAQLAPLLMSTDGSRVVNVSSMGHRAGMMHFDDLMFEKRRYNRWQPYFQSKLANLLFTFELERRLRAAGSSTQALAAHPGATATDLGHEGTGLTNVLLKPTSFLLQPVSIGALPLVRAAVDPTARGGDYFGPRFLVMGYPVRETPTRRARNEADARRLWSLSEELTGTSFDLPGR